MTKLKARLSPSGALRATLSVGKLTTPPVLQNKTVTPAVQPQTVTFDKPYDGLGEVTVEGVNLQNKSVQPSVNQQEVTFDEPFVGLGKVTVEGATAAVDANIIPENIVKDVEILGVKGTAEPPTEFEFDSGYYLCALREPYIDIFVRGLKQPTRMEYCFSHCTTRKIIDLSGVDFSKCTGSWGYAFTYCKALEELLGLDFTAMSYSADMFFQCSSVRRITFQPGSTIGAKSTSSSIIISLYTFTLLTEDALLEMLSTLGPNTTGKTRGFEIAASVYDTLSQECLDAFAAKNYTLTARSGYSLRDEEDTGEEVIEEEVIE